MHRNTTGWVVSLHGRHNRINIQDSVALFQQNSCLLSDFDEVENMEKKKLPF